MARHPNLMQRKGVWYFRRRVPTQLVELCGREFITKSLRTTDYREAVKRLRIEQGDLQKKLDDLQAKAIRPSMVDLPSQAGGVVELEVGQLQQLVNAWVDRQQTRLALSGKRARTRDHIQDLLAELAEEETRLHSPFPEDHEPLVGITLNQILASVKLPLRQQVGSIQLAAKGAGRPAFRLSTPTHDELYRLVREARTAVNHAHQRQLLDGLTAQIAFRANSVDPAKSYHLAQLLKDFRDDDGRASRREKTELDYSMVFRLLTEVIGESRPIDAITRDDCTNVRKLLLKLPRNATIRYRNVGLAKAAEIAPETERRLKLKTINSHLTKISTIFNWAVAEGKLQKTPARGLIIKASHQDGQGGRRSFTIAELQAMFYAPLYTGCVDDERNYWKVGPNTPRRARFWVPLIALFSGLRQNEICQLTSFDIEDDEGVAVIQVRVTQDWQKLKSTSARRFVPVHPELIRIGFLDYANQVRGKGTSSFSQNSNLTSGVTCRGFFRSVLTPSAIVLALVTRMEFSIRFVTHGGMHSGVRASRRRWLRRWEVGEVSARTRGTVMASLCMSVMRTYNVSDIPA